MTRRMCRRIICALKSHPPHSSEELLRERADRHDDGDSIVHVGIRGERRSARRKSSPACYLLTYHAYQARTGYGEDERLPTTTTQAIILFSSTQKSEKGVSQNFFILNVAFIFHFFPLFFVLIFCFP